MAIITREEVSLALFNLAGTATIASAPAFKFKSRKLVLWADCPLERRPALYMAERIQSYMGAERPVPAKRTWNYSFFIYTNAKNATDTNPGSAILNPLLDALLAALAPTGADLMQQRQTLGGLVNNAYVDGDVFFDPGDIDGDGMAIVPVKVLVP